MMGFFLTPYYDGVFSVNKWRQKYVSCTLKRLGKTMGNWKEVKYESEMKEL